MLDKQVEPKQEFEVNPFILKKIFFLIISIIFQYIPGNKRPVWFVYSGMGSQWNGMGRDLMQLPVFAESINKSAATLKERGVDLMKILLDDDKTIFDNILHSFVGIAAVQVIINE